MLTLHEAFAPEIADQAAAWFPLWDLDGVQDDVRVRFSTRMFRAVGRCYPARRVVSLAAPVRDFRSRQLLDVLCHEFAHIAAYELFGRSIRPHGREWQTLVAVTGHEPRVRFEDEDAINLLNARRPRQRRYLHQCPHCLAGRTAARRMPRWRCGDCYARGGDGNLRITLLAHDDA